MTPLNILLITPSVKGAVVGNRVTASRWASMLREMGHRVSVSTSFDGKPRDLLLALHATKSGDSIHAFRGAFLGRPIVVVVTGTDIYVDAPAGEPLLGTLEIADALVVLQPQTVSDLPEHLRAKARVIFQSVKGRKPARKSVRAFEVAVLANLRPVKDPLLAARAARLLPAASRIKVVGAGAVLDSKLGEAAKAESRDNPRYRWVGALSHGRAQALLGRARLCVNSSRSEGGANVLGEAIMAKTPLLATRVPGNVGLLGRDYPGLFEVGDARGLAALMRRCEDDAAFLRKLESRCRALEPQFEPARERQALAELLRSLVPQEING
ncbi:TIGR04348 family glycosyltransferase [bacterium]|nr:MAG: TIGR04348 family glycosyltransferase [bacterium]RIK61981.1 MAG: TIGR04348 family glycosyltransferase [Planctomycetota bacterium]